MSIGSDLMFTEDEDGEIDLMIGDNGDFFTTSEFEEKIIEKIPYTGYICLYNCIFRMLQTNKGTYFYDISFGNNINSYISSSIDDNLFLIKDDIETELKKDDRIKEITKIDLTIQNNDTLIIEIEFIAIGQQEKSSFVFPYSIREF